MRGNSNIPDFSDAFRLSPTNSDSDENLDFIDLAKQPENYLGANSIIDRVLSARTRATPQPHNAGNSNENSDVSRQISVSSKESARSSGHSRPGTRPGINPLARRQSIAPSRRSSTGSRNGTRRKSSVAFHADSTTPAGASQRTGSVAVVTANRRMSTVRSPMMNQNPRAIHRCSSQLSIKLHVLLVRILLFLL